MEIRQLEYFVAVAEELSFTRAARRLHVVQSGVSAAVQALDQWLQQPDPAAAKWPHAHRHRV